MAAIDSGWKRKVFRLSGLPNHVTEKQDIACLLCQGLDNIEPDDILICSSAPTLNCWEDQPSNIATLMFRRTPSLFLTSKDQTRWSVDIPGLDDTLTLDSNFLGLTPLSTVHAVNHIADCIAVSGLSSHPFGSWAAKGDDKRFMWIRDAVPKSLPGFRAIIYGYDSDIGRTTSCQSISDLARELVDQLRAGGWKLPDAPPIIFIAHSLGGIVVKDAIRQLSNSEELSDQAILFKIRGLVLLGAPNLGMDESSFLSVVEGQPNEMLIEDLSRRSDYLRHLDEAFLGLCHTRQLEVFWGYETRKSPVTTRKADGTLMRGPAHVELVTPYSATSRMVNKAPEKTFSISETHSELAKFTKDSLYLPVVISKLGALLDFVDRRREEEAKTRLIAAENVTSNLANGDKELPNIKDLLRSLEAPDLDQRQKEIANKSENTFEWIFEHEDLTQWLQDGTGIFWIHGKPGSGKSTLMKFLFEDKRTWQLLNMRLLRNEQVRAGFFFHHRGSSIQKSFYGLLRSIVCQLLKQQPRLSLELKSLLPKDVKNGLTQNFWDLARLKHALRLILDQSIMELDACFFFDALDEFDGPPEIICNLLKDLGGGMCGSKTHVRVLFSSRPWPIFESHFRDCPEFSLHKHTGRDLLNYCADYVSTQNCTHQMVSALFPQITEKANGSFLWVRLVLRSLCMEAEQDSTEDGLKAILQSMPEELSHFYASIVRRMSSSHRLETYALLELVVRESKIALSPAYVVEAVACSLYHTYQATQKCLSEHELLPEAQLEQLIGKWGGGLVEITKSQDTGVLHVQLLHQTVHEFVVSLGFKELALGRLAVLTDENGYSFHAKYRLAKRPRLHRKSAFWVTLQDAGLYARYSEITTGKSQKVFLDSIPTDILYSLSHDLDGDPALDPSRARSRRSTGTSPLGFAAYHALDLYIIDTITSDESCLESCRDRLLDCVALSRGNPSFKDTHFRTAQLLLDRGYPIANESGTITKLISRPFLWESTATDSNSLLLVRLAFRHGYQPPSAINEQGSHFHVNNVYTIPTIRQSRISTSATLLHFRIPVAMAEFLIEQGLDPNATDSCGHTPLDVALMLHFADSVQTVDELQNTYQLVCLFLKHGGQIRQIDYLEVKRNLDEFDYYYWDTSDIRASVVHIGTSPRLPVVLEHLLEGDPEAAISGTDQNLESLSSLPSLP